MTGEQIKELRSMKRLKNFIYRNFICKHERKKQRNKLVYYDGQPVYYYGQECKDCGKVWRL